MDDSRIPNRLKHYRKNLRLLQTEVIQILNLGDLSTISRWEQGIAFPSTLHLFGLCWLYKTTIEQLYPTIWKQIKNEIENNLLIKK